MVINLSHNLVAPYNIKCNTNCHEMFHTNWELSKTLKKKIDKTIENHITKTLQFDGKYISEISPYKNKLSEETNVSKYNF